MTPASSTARTASPVPAMIRGALVPGLVLGPVAATVGYAAGGPRAAASAAGGAGSVLVILLIGLLAITAVVTGPVGLSMAGAGVVYLGQLVLLVALVAVLQRLEGLDGGAFALAAIAQALAMQVGQIVGYVRARHVLDVTMPGERR